MKGSGSNTASRQHWLLVLIIVAVNLSARSHNVSANTSSLEPAVSHALANNTKEISAGGQAFKVAIGGFASSSAQPPSDASRPPHHPDKAHPDPTIKVATSTDNECSCPGPSPKGAEPLSSPHRVGELTIELESLRANFSHAVSDCQNELAAATASRNDSIQTVNSLEAKIERMEKNYVKLSNETNSELDRLEDLVERQKRQVSECQNELAATTASRNDSIETVNSLEAKIERMEKNYVKLSNETNTELDRLEDLVERQKRQLKLKEDRYQDQRRQFLAVDGELRRMHASALGQYVNFTLMRDDAWNGVAQALSKASHRVERRWGRRYRNLRPWMREEKRKFDKMYREAKAHFRPKVIIFRRRMNNRWSRSTIVRPLLERSWEKISIQALALYRPYKPAVEEVREAFRLSVISAIEEASRIAIHFLEREDRMKLEREEQERKRERDPVQRRLERRRNGRRDSRDRAAPSRKTETGPSLVNLRTRAFFKHTLANSEELYEKGVALLPLAVALTITKSTIVGSFLFFWRVPTQLIWMFSIVKFILSARRRTSKGEASEGLEG